MPSKLLEDNASYKKQAEEFAKFKASELAKVLTSKARVQGNIKLIVATHVVEKGGDPTLLRTAALMMQKELENTALVAAFAYEGKPQLLLMYSDDLVAKGKNAGKDIRPAAKFILGGGGGQPTLATAGGKECEGLKEALECLIATATA